MGSVLSHPGSSPGGSALHLLHLGFRPALSQCAWESPLEIYTKAAINAPYQCICNYGSRGIQLHQQIGTSIAGRLLSRTAGGTEQAPHAA